MKPSISLNAFLRLESKHRLSARPLEFSGTVHNVRVEYHAFRKEVTCFLVGLSPVNHKPAHDFGLVTSLHHHIEQAILAHRQSPSPF